MVLNVAPRIPFQDTSYNDQLDTNEVMQLLDLMYAHYEITDDADKIAFRSALYKYVFLNGTSDRAEFTGNITVSGAKLSLKPIASWLRGKSRKFFRRLQYDAYDFLTDPANLALRLEVAAKYRGEILGEQQAPCAIDFFKECLSTEEGYIAEPLKQRRIANSWTQRSKGQRRPNVPEFQEPRQSPGGGSAYTDNY
jgi:hypothetical protein